MREPTRIRIKHDTDEWTVSLGGTLSGSQARVHRVDVDGPYVYTVGSPQWADKAQVHDLKVLEWSDVERDDVLDAEVATAKNSRKDQGWTPVFEWQLPNGRTHLVFQRSLDFGVPTGA